MSALVRCAPQKLGSPCSGEGTPLAWAGVALLIAVSLMAGLIPVSRVLHTDFAETLRYE